MNQQEPFFQEIEDIEDYLYDSGSFDYSYLPEQILPILRSHTEQATQMFMDYLSDQLDRPAIDDDVATCVALGYFFAEVHATRAFPLLITYLRHAAKSIDLSTCLLDYLPIELPSIFYATYDGDLDKVREYICDQTLPAELRYCLGKMLGALCAQNCFPRHICEQLLKSYADTVQAFDEDGSVVVQWSMRIGATDLFPDLSEIYLDDFAMALAKEHMCRDDLVMEDFPSHGLLLPHVPTQLREQAIAGQEAHLQALRDLYKHAN